MELSQYRATPSEQKRTADLLRLMPTTGRRALDIGARDGHFSHLMAERFGTVVALDLTMPRIEHPAVRCVEGDAAKLPFGKNEFDFVFCAEVLEHIPPSMLPQVCQEIQRVAHYRILVGVPYAQDLRVGRTTCYSCGGPNPPWGHVNAFDERRIKELFSDFAVEDLAFVGQSRDRTNWLSTALMDFAGNPYGTYDQEEACIHCGARLLRPPPRNLGQLVATKLGFWCRRVTECVSRSRGNWMHVLLRRINVA